MSDKLRLISPVFRMNHPAFDAPKTPKLKDGKKGKPAYGSDMILDAEALGKFRMEDESGTVKEVNIDTLCREMAAKKWPGRELKEVFAKFKGGSNWPIKNGDKVIAANNALDKPKKLDFLAGKYQMACKAYPDYAPTLSYLEAGKRVELSRENPEDMKKIKKMFVGGSYALAELSMVPQETENGNYIIFYVNSVVFIRPGERLGGSSLLDRMDTFAGIEGGEADYDPSGDSLDDL